MAVHAPALRIGPRVRGPLREGGRPAKQVVGQQYSLFRYVSLGESAPGFCVKGEKKELYSLFHCPLCLF